MITFSDQQLAVLMQVAGNLPISLISAAPERARPHILEYQ
jgi:hypothetical protein